jgi:uncharacterized membrane protein
MRCSSCGQENPPEARFCANCGAALEAATLEPGVWKAYGNGWRQLWKNFLELFLIGIIYVVISLLFGTLQWIIGPYSFGFIGFIYDIFIGGPLGYGMSYAYLKAARQDEVEVNDLFAAFKNYWSAVLANILVSIIIAIGFILLIIPGIYFACKLVFTPYLVVDRKMEVIEAIKTSWEMTNGHAWKVFLIGLLAIPIFLAGLICFGVGVIISVMWVSTTFASLYHAVSTSRPVPQPVTPPGPIKPAS